MNKNKQPLPCAVVKDLLPSYIDGLTSAETSKLIVEHLESCHECNAAYDTMTEPDIEATLEHSGETDAEEVRYLKKIKRRHRITIVSVVAGLLALFLLAYYFLAVHIFPFPVEDFKIVEQYQLSDGSIYIKTYVEGDISAITTFAYTTTYIKNPHTPLPDGPENPLDFEYHFGYRMVDRLAPDIQHEGAYYHFLITREDLEETGVEAVYLCGWDSDNRLPLWQKSDIPAPPSAEQEEYIEQKILPNMGVGFYRTYE